MSDMPAKEHKFFYSVILPALIAAATSLVLTCYQINTERGIASVDRKVELLKEELHSMISLASEIQSLAFKLPMERRFDRLAICELKRQETILDDINSVIESNRVTKTKSPALLDELRDKSFNRRDYLSDRVSADTKELMETLSSLRRSLHEALFTFSDKSSTALAGAYNTINTYSVNVNVSGSGQLVVEDSNEDKAVDKYLSDSILIMRDEIQEVSKQIKEIAR